jgi:hypothetical protein
MDDQPTVREPAPLPGSTYRDPEPAPSLSSLVAQLTDDARSLVRQELDIAKAEATATAKSLAISGAFVAVGVVLLLVGVVVLTVFLILGLGALLGERYWLSTLIIGGVFSIAGLVAVLRGRKALRKDSLKPELALATALDTREWVKAEVAEMKRDLSN